MQNVIHELELDGSMAVTWSPSRTTYTVSANMYENLIAITMCILY